MHHRLQYWVSQSTGTLISLVEYAAHCVARILAVKALHKSLLLLLIAIFSDAYPVSISIIWQYETHKKSLLFD